MHYVKYFDINGVETAQIPCIEIQGAPNAATKGVVGLLAMDMSSDTHELYKCVKVDGAVYTWECVTRGKDGKCITKADINADGELVLTLSDGTTLNVGVVRGEKGEKGNDGVSGKNGNDGVSITNTYIDDHGQLIVTLSNNESITAGIVKGEQGVSVVKMELNEKKELVTTLSNGTVMNLGTNGQSMLVSENSCLSTEFIGKYIEPGVYTFLVNGMMFSNVYVPLTNVGYYLPCRAYVGIGNYFGQTFTVGECVLILQNNYIVGCHFRLYDDYNSLIGEYSLDQVDEHTIYWYKLDSMITDDGSGIVDDTLAGAWLFKETVSGRSTDTVWQVNFGIENNLYTHFCVTSDARVLVGHSEDQSEMWEIYDGSSWMIENRRIVITSKYAEITSGGASLRSWLRNNATKQ